MNLTTIICITSNQIKKCLFADNKQFKALFLKAHCETICETRQDNTLIGLDTYLRVFAQQCEELHVEANQSQTYNALYNYWNDGVKYIIAE